MATRPVVCSLATWPKVQVKARASIASRIDSVQRFKYLDKTMNTKNKIHIFGFAIALAAMSAALPAHADDGTGAAPSTWMRIKAFLAELTGSDPVPYADRFRAQSWDEVNGTDSGKGGGGNGGGNGGSSPPKASR